MADSIEKRALQALQAEEEEVARFLHDPPPKVIKSLLQNRALNEQDVLVIANRKNLPGEVLQSIGKDRRWAKSYPIRLALAKNPKTPLFVAISTARYLRLFDLAEICRSHFLPLTYRHKIEALIMEKLPTMPLGVKKTLAKTASANVLFRMMKEGNREVTQLCLGNPHLTEYPLYKIINGKDTPALTIRLMAEHPNWSNRPAIRFALVRNSHLALATCVEFLQGMRATDLRELYEDPSVPVTVKPYIHSELMARGEDAEKAEEEDRVYEIEEELNANS